MKLDVFERQGLFYVAWYSPEEGEGGHVGQEHMPEKRLLEMLEEAKADRTDAGWDMYEYLSVEIAAKRWCAGTVKPLSAPVARRGGLGIEFDEASVAKRFLAAMRAAAKAARSEYHTGVPWPEWAKQASAAGWKPPKGWRP